MYNIITCAVLGWIVTISQPVLAALRVLGYALERDPRGQRTRICRRAVLHVPDLTRPVSHGQGDCWRLPASIEILFLHSSSGTEK